MVSLLYMTIYVSNYPLKPLHSTYKNVTALNMYQINVHSITERTSFCRLENVDQVYVILLSEDLMSPYELGEYRWYERVICGKYLQPTEAVLIDFNLVEC